MLAQRTRCRRGKAFPSTLAYRVCHAPAHGCSRHTHDRRRSHVITMETRNSHRCGQAITSVALAALLDFNTVDADDRVSVLDRGDLPRLGSLDEGFRTNELLGTDVHGNAGGSIREVENFVVACGGYLYAVIDTADGPLEELVTLGTDETVVVPWNELGVQPND
jgi:hypothetical protein